MGLHYRAGVCALALTAGCVALQLEPAVIRDLMLDNGTHRVTVGAVKVPLWSAAFAQSADTFSLENVSFAFGSTTYEAKRIEFSGVSSSRADIEALFSATSTEPMESRLKRITVKRITIPEARVTQTVGTQSQTTTYRNATLSDVADGRVASILIETSATETSGPKNSALISMGRTSLNELDLPALARLYETKADSDNAPLIRLYGTFSIENTEVADNEDGVTVRIARLNGQDFQGRPTRDSWTGTVSAMTEMADRKDLSSGDQARLVSVIADLLDAFHIGGMEASGIEVSSKGKDSPGQGRISRIAYTGSANGQPADVRWEGFEFSDKDNRVKIDGLSLTGFSFKQTIEGLRTLQGKSFDDIDPAAMRSLVPTLGTLRLSGLSIDGTTDDEGKKVKVQAALKGFELTADRPINAVPTNIRIGLQNFAMALPSNSSDDGIKELVALGYKNVDVSFGAAATWNESTSEIMLNEVSFQGQDMGTVGLSGRIGNVGKDIFNADTAIATVALVGAKAKALDLTVQNSGLFERYMAKAAKEQKTTPESLRRTYAAAAAFVVPAMLGSSDQAQALSQAIARFIAKPGKLTINATPKDPSGFGIAEAVVLPDPKAILDKLNVSAKAE
ncbi:hypothetical protein [Microvirga lotononidis]|uniref:Uncharacterized protein n=1 Tax=Microvirga lotononidis TaxID=864069 RepID=I4YX06_9HYPH|nr:hypothetical protein [Microvirga lotononidis]EIM28498.1 hypothetical protein MicloDRAFT_00050840 [Microvirga lotononidis]WQO27430.1 hypothetical protein U0023_22780 [Microvirga lotononidis]